MSQAERPTTQEELYRLYAQAERGLVTNFISIFQTAGIEYVFHRQHQSEPLKLGAVSQAEVREAAHRFKRTFMHGKRTNQLLGASTFNSHEMLAESLSPLRERTAIIHIGTLGQVIESGLVVLPQVADCLGILAQVTSGPHAGAISATHWPMYAAAYAPGSPAPSLEVVKQTIQALVDNDLATLEDEFGVLVCGLEFRPQQYQQDVRPETILDLKTDIHPNPSHFKRNLVSHFDNQLNLRWATVRVATTSPNSPEKKAYNVFALTDPDAKAQIEEITFI